MANDDRVKVEPTRVEIDNEGLAEDLKSVMPEPYAEREFELEGDESSPVRRKPEVSSEAVGSNGYDYERSYGRSYTSDDDYYRSYDDDNYRRGTTMSRGTVEVPTTGPRGEGLDKEKGEGKPSGAGATGAVSVPTSEPAPKQKPQVGGESPKTGDKKAPKTTMGGEKGPGQKQPLDENGEPREMTEGEKRKAERKRQDENNANTIKNAADVAIASKNPYAMAAGGIVKAADKASGGKSTELLGKAMTTANRVSPGGRRIQKASNYLAESGAGDKIGTAASMKNGDASKAGEKAADTADKAKKAKDAGDKAKQAGDKAKAGSKTKGKLSGKTNTSANDTSGPVDNQHEGTAIMDRMGRAVMHFFLRHPFALIVVILLIVFLILMLSDSESDGSGGHRYCSYQVSGVTSTGTVKLDNVQVELINCDGTASNYTVLETVDFEKYVLGVALAEIGESSPDEGIKAQIIAARNFALTRNSGMCPSNPDNCFYGYNVETGKIRMRACEADQVYWDYTKDIYRQDRGSISLYSPEINSGTVWKHALSAERQSQVLALAESVKGKVLLDESGNVMPTSYKSTDQVSMLEDARAGKSYEEILEHKYGSSKFSSATCSNYGNIDYGNYQLSSEGDVILNERLDKFLESKGTSLQEFNSLIESNVKKNGYGTRAGVVTAAVTLIAELGNNYDTKVPYFLSGGHHDGVRQGALGYWGSGYEDDGRRCYYTGYGNVYTVCGLDCSGFVPWAIKNGGFQMGVRLAGDFQSLDGARRVSLSSSSAVLEPGDLLESGGHIVLVVGVDESSNQYICAEAAGKSSGVLFTRRPFTGGSGYWGVKMDGYYDKYSLAGK